jgi:mannose/fructose-specific phosphotransferase system component IIA
MHDKDTKKELGFIIVTHGDIGVTLLATAEYILGRKLTNFIVVKVPFMSELRQVMESDCPLPFARRRQLIAEQIRQAKERVDRGNGVVVLADLVGGTSFTVAGEILAPEEGIIIAGVNLPMLLKAAELHECSPQAAARDLVERSRRAIVYRLPTGGAKGDGGQVDGSSG